MNKNVLFLFCILSLLSCKGQIQSSYIKIDTISFSIKDLLCTNDTLSDSSVVLLDSILHLTKYFPIKCNIHFTDKRPDKDNDNIKLCVPAAFTSNDLKYIVGDYVVNGHFVGQSPDVETGYCAIMKGKVFIRPLDEFSDKILIRCIENKGDFFRQMLLIYGNETVPCTIFDKYKPTYRRALVEKDKSFFIVESEERISISIFQQMLIKIGVKSALYLDMGTWSEGFYRDLYNAKVTIGKQIQSTKYQTNWLVFEKQ